MSVHCILRTVCMKCAPACLTISITRAAETGVQTAEFRVKKTKRCCYPSAAVRQGPTPGLCVPCTARELMSPLTCTVQLPALNTQNFSDTYLSVFYDVDIEASACVFSSLHAMLCYANKHQPYVCSLVYLINNVRHNALG